MRAIVVSGWIFNDPQMLKSKKGADYMSFKMTNWQYGDPVTVDGKHKSLFLEVTCFDNTTFQLLNSGFIKKNRHVTVMGDIQSVNAYIGKDGVPAASLNIRAKAIYLDDYSGATNANGTTTAPSVNGTAPLSVAPAPNANIAPNGYVGANPAMTLSQPQMAPNGMPYPQAGPAVQVAQPMVNNMQMPAQAQIPQQPVQMAMPQMQPQGYVAQTAPQTPPMSAQTAQTLEQLKQVCPVDPNAGANGDLPF